MDGPMMRTETAMNRPHQNATSTPPDVANSPKAGSSDATPRSQPASVPAVEELTTAECWRLVEASTLGRLAVDGLDGRPDLFPLNFVVRDGNLFVRSGPGKKLRSITQRPAVAFEVDGGDEHHHWSVVIRADAKRMDTDADIRASGILDLVSLNPTPKHIFIRLTPLSVTGRRFPQRAVSAPATERRSVRSPSDVVPGAGDGRHLPTEARHASDEKPQPIPHQAPLPH
jgi:hypothetical protein